MPDLEAINSIGLKRNVVDEAAPVPISVFFDDFETILGLYDTKVMPMRILVEAEKLHCVELVQGKVQLPFQGPYL